MRKNCQLILIENELPIKLPLILLTTISPPDNISGAIKRIIYALHTNKFKKMNFNMIKTKCVCW